MQIQAINQHAKGKYHDFTRALEEVRMALDETAKLVKKIGNAPDGRFGGWQVPDREEVQASLKKARAQLNTLHTNAVKWEKELVSRGWRV